MSCEARPQFTIHAFGVEKRDEMWLGGGVKRRHACRQAFKWRA